MSTQHVFRQTNVLIAHMNMLELKVDHDLASSQIVLWHEWLNMQAYYLQLQ